MISISDLHHPRLPPRKGLALSLRELRQRLESAIDPFCGIVGSIEAMDLAPELGGLFSGYAASLGNPSALRRGIKILNPMGLAGYGTAISPDLAAVRALSEALERYCSLLPPPASARCRTTARALGSAALDCGSFARCSEAELSRAGSNRLAPPDLDRTCEWIHGVSLTAGREIWVPLTAVYLGLDLPLAEHCAYPISTGFAAGQSYDDAILSGLLEVVERDSLALWWLAQMPAPLLEAAALRRPETRAAVDALAARGIDTNFFDLTTDTSAPVIGVIQLSERTFPHVVVMAACRLSGEDAALRVLEECASLRVVLIGQRRVGDDFSDVLAGGPASAERFGLYHAGPDSYRNFRVKVKNSTVAQEMPPAIHRRNALKRLVRRLASLGHEVVVVDVTVPEVRAQGIVVVRVLVPRLMPISFAHAIRHLDHPRLTEALARFGTRVPEAPIPYA